METSQRRVRGLWNQPRAPQYSKETQDMLRCKVELLFVIILNWKGKTSWLYMYCMQVKIKFALSFKSEIILSPDVQ